jgi:4-amino-4-deoxy-L-arabinose transferase-like glycosyltransferase
MEPVRERVAPRSNKEFDEREQRAVNVFLLALALYFLIQIVIRVVQKGALTLDEAEMVFDSQQLRLGYGIQPPLYTWLQWLVFQFTGVTHFGLSVLKNASIFALYVCVFQLARLLLGTLAAAAITSSLALLVPLGWDAFIDRTHSLLATALAAGALWTYFLLLRKPDRLRSALLGLLIGLGMLSKYNFAIFVLGLVAASLLVSEHRKAIWTRDMWITVSVATLCLLPHAAWFIQQLDTATAETLNKMKAGDHRAGYAENVARGSKHFFLSIASFITPLWAALAIAYRSPRAGTLQLRTPQARFFLWLFGTGLACIAALVLSGHLSHIKSRWLQTLLFALPLAWFVIFPPQTPAVYRRLLVVTAGAALVMLVGLSMRPQLKSAFGNGSRIAEPYPELTAELVRRFGEFKVVGVQNRWIGGNVRIQLPQVRTLTLDELCAQAPFPGERVLVLIEAGQKRRGGPGLERCPALDVVERGQISAHYPDSMQNSLLFNYALVKREPK